jgi:tetratricopeptide (TPR) repeat protein
MPEQRKGRRTRGLEQPVSSRLAGFPDQRAHRQAVVHLLVLAAVSLTLYANTLRNGFVTDDNLQLRENKFITNYHYIPKLFTANVWEFLGKRISNYYRPLQMLFYMGEYYLFGLGHPWFWHLVAVLLHIAAVFAAYFLIRALADEKLALWAALVFAFHPIHVEVVAWIAALPELLCALSLFTAIHFYHLARTTARPVPNHGIATAVFFVGLFCKETALVLPALLLAYEFFYRRESFRDTWLGLRRLLPYLCALGFYVAIRVRVLGTFAPLSAHFTRRETLLTVPVLLCQYIFKVLLPVRLNYYYEFTPQNTFDWRVAGSIAVIGALVVAMFWLRKARPLLAFAMAWFFITIAPVLNISRLGRNVFTEHYLYIPSLGICILAGWAWLRIKEAVSPRRLIAVAYALLALVLILYTALIVNRVPDWRSDISIYQKGAVLFPKSANAETSLGIAYYEAGQSDLAMTSLEHSLSLDPNSYLAQLYTALTLSAVGDNQEASAHLLRAEELNTDPLAEWSLFAQAHANLNQWDRAIEYDRKELSLEPQNPVLYTTLGEALQANGQTQESIAAFRQAIRLDPGSMDASTNLAITLAEEDDTDEAIKLLDFALRIHPDGLHADAGWFNLGNIHAHKAEWDAAAAAYKHALELNPDLDAARQRLESVQAQQAAQRQ